MGHKICDIQVGGYIKSITTIIAMQLDVEVIRNYGK